MALSVTAIEISTTGSTTSILLGIYKSPSFHREMLSEQLLIIIVVISMNVSELFVSLLDPRTASALFPILSRQFVPSTRLTSRAIIPSNINQCIQ